MRQESPQHGLRHAPPLVPGRDRHLDDEQRRGLVGMHVVGGGGAADDLPIDDRDGDVVPRVVQEEGRPMPVDRTIEDLGIRAKQQGSRPRDRASCSCGRNRSSCVRYRTLRARAGLSMSSGGPHPPSKGMATNGG